MRNGAWGGYSAVSGVPGGAGCQVLGVLWSAKRRL